MATLKRKSDTIEVTLHQWCNDWFTVDSPQKQGMVVNPTRLTLTEDERDRVRESIARGETGHMAMLYELHDDGTFTERSEIAHRSREEAHDG